MAAQEMPKTPLGSCIQRFAIFVSAMLCTLIVYMAIFSHPSGNKNNQTADCPSLPQGSIGYLEIDVQYVRKIDFESVIPNIRVMTKDKGWNRSSTTGRCGPEANFTKGQRILINYGSQCCEKSQPKNCRSALDVGGFDVCLMFNETSIDANFRARNAAILQSTTGAGYWLWKPYIILKTLLQMGDDDWLVYSDSGSFFVENFDFGPICLLAKNSGDIAIFTTEHKERLYTKADTFLLMNCNDDLKCKDGMHVSSSVVLLRKSWRSIQFISQWLTYAQDERLITNEPSSLVPGGYEDYKFIAHRNDQSILSILAKKWSIEHWPNPSQYGERPFHQILRNSPQYVDYLNKNFIEHTRDLN